MLYSSYKYLRVNIPTRNVNNALADPWTKLLAISFSAGIAVKVPLTTLLTKTFRLVEDKQKEIF